MTTPPIWYRLPPGFHDVGPHDRAALIDIAADLGSSRAQDELTDLTDRLSQLSAHQVVCTSIGLHPDELNGVSTSLFSVSIRRMDGSNPALMVARTALDITRSELWRNSTRRFIDLPSALPCCLISGTLSLPKTEQHVFQARVVTAHPDGLHVLILDLTSASIEHSEAYTDILEAVTHTVCFSDPLPAPESPTTTRPSRISEVLL
ncbi:hypothetical protein [Streptomyces sp. LN699]|uniref:hypothetical protein n=1 Tax=Streptomyces sp. LN699 TaxID=3112981 RepID=UPI0037225F66